MPHLDHHRTAGNPQREWGFTLLEMLIALSILALAVTLAGSMMLRSSQDQRINSAVQRLAADIAQTRALAMRTGASQRIDFDLIDRRYVGGDGLAAVLPPSLEVRMITAEELAVGARPAILFYPDGGSSGAAIELTSEAGRYYIEADWLTGEISVRREALDGET